MVDHGSGAVLTYRELHAQVAGVAFQLRRLSRSLVLVFASNDLSCIICYLGALQAGHAVFLSPMSARHPGVAALVRAYRPELILMRLGAIPTECAADYEAQEPLVGYLALRRRQASDTPPHSSLALLLSTSASTGSSKTVRLSLSALAASAAQVADALGLAGGDRALLSLPLSFVYGLSVLNSSLYAGSEVALIPGTFADRSFYPKIAAAEVTSLACVSQVLGYMRQLQVDGSVLPAVSRITHSGSALDPQLFAWVYQTFGKNGASIYLMYGQTEACGRISVLEPDALPERQRSVGRVIQGGELFIAADGEITYRGPGVMLGYATCREDLELGDVLGGTLATGDVGHLDEQGYLFITGRKSRYCKVFDQRINLDDVEAFVRADRAAAVVEREGSLLIFFEQALGDVPATILQVARQFKLPPNSIRLRAIPELPRTPHGKIAYNVLLSMS